MHTEIFILRQFAAKRENVSWGTAEIFKIVLRPRLKLLGREARASLSERSADDPHEVVTSVLELGNVLDEGILGRFLGPPLRAVNYF